MKINIIIGKSNTRKSSTIRALTGIRIASVFDIKYENGEVRSTLIIPSALQEHYCISPSDFIKLANNPSLTEHINLTEKITNLNKIITSQEFDNILICLRETGINGLQNAEEYIHEFENAGWIINAPIISFNGKFKDATFIESKTIPTNEVASKIRNHWAWL